MEATHAKEHSQAGCERQQLVSTAPWVCKNAPRAGCDFWEQVKHTARILQSAFLISKLHCALVSTIWAGLDSLCWAESYLTPGLEQVLQLRPPKFMGSHLLKQCVLGPKVGFSDLKGLSLLNNSVILRWQLSGILNLGIMLLGHNQRIRQL